MDRARSETRVRICAVDIGTNTFLLLIADISGDGTLIPVLQEQRIPRIGRAVDAQRLIALPAFDRSVWILTEYRNLAQQYRCDSFVACGTSAVRDAANREDFLRYLETETGIRVEVLSGMQEAGLTYRGAVSDSEGDPAPRAVIDIGGGSTELIFPSAPGVVPPFRSISAQLGAVRITERYFHTDPPGANDVRSGKNFIRASFQSTEIIPPKGCRLFGVAGTVTTLACLDQNLDKYDAARVTGYTMSRQSVVSWGERLAGMTAVEIRTLSGVTEGRADIVTAGVMILETVMDLFGFEEIVATDRGLRHGIALREFERLRS
jgi:exopolyphosphatase/guanosine-5'-triphosphate,3'-diphosphate pyrophosphatase